MTEWGNRYWPVFLIIVSLLFLFPELTALFTNPANTLSDYCWRELDVTVAFGHGKHTLAWWLSIFAWFLAFWLLTFHIWFRSI